MIYICGKCKKIYKIQGNGKKMKCPNCKDVFLFDSGISDEVWKTKSKEEKEEIKNRKPKTASANKAAAEKKVTKKK